MTQDDEKDRIIAELRRQLAESQAYRASQSGDGATAQGDGADAAGKQAVIVRGDSSAPITTSPQLSAGEGAQIIYAEEGATIVIGDAQIPMRTVDQKTELGKYLRYVISQNRYLQLQGIRSGGKLVNIELDRIYITLRAAPQGIHEDDLAWLAVERGFAPGEQHRSDGMNPAPGEHRSVSVNEALAAHPRMVILGDPGSGKTTLLRYMALLYARDVADGTGQVEQKLGLPESQKLPIFIPLRQLGRYLGEHHPREDGTEGPLVVLRFLAQMLQNENIAAGGTFFDPWLEGGAVILFDGLDEVADPDLRRRVSRLVDAFTRAYPRNRYVVTSRVVGYTEMSQLNEGYAVSKALDFTLQDVERFLTQWHRLVAIGQMGPGESAEHAAARQTQQLLRDIEDNQRVRELAINPLMLTVIALIHRDRVKLPERRAELYAEAIDVLLGKWDEARGVQGPLILDTRSFDISDRRLALQAVALRMHEQKIKEIDAEPLRLILREQLSNAVDDPRDLDMAVTRFLEVIQERTGLLIARGEGVFSFSHLTFQEYLAALAVAGRDDYVEHTLRRAGEEWWREVILLEAGHLSAQSSERTSRLIRAIANAKQEPALYHNLVLAAECIRDAGAGRVAGDIEAEIRRGLRAELESPAPQGALASLQTFFARGMSAKAALRRRIAAAEALGQIGGSSFWSRPYGEPEWITIPAGPFQMGEGAERHTVILPEFWMARAPVTNAQYELFVRLGAGRPPDRWEGRAVPRGREAHPVTDVTWRDAMAYCRWLSQMCGKLIRLPSEAEWEKAARGDTDSRIYPWGDDFDPARCNTRESGIGDTTPVGVFARGASPYGCLDMAGNVWEWTRSLWSKDGGEPEFGYPYDPSDARREDEEVSDDVGRVLRGGSWGDARGYV